MGTKDITKRNQSIYILYNWVTVILWAGFIWWMSSIPKIILVESDSEVIIKTVGHMLSFGFLFLLIYRTLLTTFKFKVERLAFWRTRQERTEDAQFVFIVETLLLAISILLSVLYAIGDEYHQIFVDGKSADIKDVLVNSIGILVVALITYSVPVITEAEVMIVRKLKSKRSKKKKNK
ncbi:MAG TPA: hypothetical protein ENI23_03175 [bacterium]|nr:hypothetical protein [bacterium]